MFELPEIPKALYSPVESPLINGILRGVERECLRVSPEATLSNGPHPQPLGSALTHPHITTDFSEALLEFITPPTHRVQDLFDHLHGVQQYTAHHLGNELLWPTSMPCTIGNDAQIPVAHYGSSNNGKMKTAYRVGLGHRYGRTMQTVAGVHYNFSLPNAFWAFLSAQDNSLQDLQAYKDERYFQLIRNFRRHYWLLIYLFGASPALSSSFVQNRPHTLQPLNNRKDTLHLPYATSLRMGDLGYQSSAQESLFVCYNQKSSYIQTLCCAITRKHPQYDAIGLLDDQHNYKQLNTSLLQIENEFYSAIRPKRTARHGETALAALSNRGVEYIEVRCLDANPFSPYGLTEAQVHFLDTFLIYCALHPSGDSDREEFDIMLKNQKRVVTQGRDPELQLEHFEQGRLSLHDWASQLLNAMKPVATMMDNANKTNQHLASLSLQEEKVLDPNKTPSAQLLKQLSESGQSFTEFTLDLARKHKQQLLEQPIDPSQWEKQREMAEKSHAEQASLESQTQIPFDQFLSEYYRQYTQCKHTQGP